MKTKIVQSLLLSAGLASALMSCSKRDDVQPAVTTSLSTVATTPQVKLVNGRLVFADLIALNKTRDALTSFKDEQALIAWEKNLNFVSLRANAEAERGHLEELDLQGKPAPANDLMMKFGFPVAYASLINPAGEFQVGDKIYWFHEGVKYQAASEQDLDAIKQNPSIAKVKLAAGSKLPNGAKNLTSIANRTTAHTDPYCDDKYNSGAFPLNGDNASQRRIIYGINVYTEDDGEDGSGFYHYYKSALNLFIKYEYQATRTGKWYALVGQDFHYVGDVYINATCVAPYVAGYPFGILPTHQDHLSETLTISNGLHAATLAVQTFATSTVDPFLSPDQITWDFENTGSITGYPTLDPGHTYTANASPLW